MTTHHQAGLTFQLLRNLKTWTSRTISVTRWTRKASCRWQTRAMLAKRLHGLCKSSGVVSCIASLPIDSLHMVYYYRHIVTLSKMHHFRDMTTYWSKIAKKPTPPSFSTFLLQIFWRLIPCQKLESWGYQTVYISRSCFRSARHNTGVTDRWTDRQTHCCRKDRTSIASHG